MIKRNRPYDYNTNKVFEKTEKGRCKWCGTPNMFFNGDFCSVECKKSMFEMYMKDREELIGTLRLR